MVRTKAAVRLSDCKQAGVVRRSVAGMSEFKIEIVYQGWAEPVILRLPGADHEKAETLLAVINDGVAKARAEGGRQTHIVNFACGQDLTVQAARFESARVIEVG
jgi:hypothetical protein